MSVDVVAELEGIISHTTVLIPLYHFDVLLATRLIYHRLVEKTGSDGLETPTLSGLNYRE